MMSFFAPPEICLYLHQISLSMGDYAKMMATAEQIRDAVLESENTAVKVGGLLVDMLALIDKVMPDGWVDESGVVITWRGVWSNLERYFNGTTIREETGKRERSLCAVLWLSVAMQR